MGNEFRAIMHECPVLFPFTIGEYVGDQAEIADPFGGDKEEYLACFEELEVKIKDIFNA